MLSRMFAPYHGHAHYAANTSRILQLKYFMIFHSIALIIYKNCTQITMFRNIILIFVLDVTARGGDNRSWLAIHTHLFSSVSDNNLVKEWTRKVLFINTAENVKIKKLLMMTWKLGNTI